MSTGCWSRLVPGATRALPEVHTVDRAALQRAEAAATAALAAIRGPSTPDALVDDLTTLLGRVTASVRRLAAETGRARTFLERHPPERLARARADLELRQLSASTGELLALRKEATALAARAALADRVQSELPVLEARLRAAGEELEAFRARVEARTSGAELHAELIGYQRAVDAAYTAFERTRAELG
jgi:hypothetical protein